MKQIIIFLSLAFNVIISLAQSPQSIPYQAIVRNTDGSVMASAAMTITFKIHDNTATGTVVYEENHTATTNSQGLISLNVGNGAVVSGTFSGINWGSGSKFLHVLMNAGNGVVDLGTQQMMSVPYSLYSTSAFNAGNGFSNVSQIGDTLYMSNGSFIIIPGISAANFTQPILGCIDVNACNFNNLATFNDNSCLYIGSLCDDLNDSTINDSINASCICEGIVLISGCTNPVACNFNSLANYNDGTCLIINSSCNDSQNSTYNDSVNDNCICEGIPLINGKYYPGNGAVDADGNTYTSIVINGREWMQQNLSVSKYRNGDSIPSGLVNTDWQNTTSGSYSIINNQITNNDIYGKLYNWYAVADSRGLCPTGWHVSSSSDWSNLWSYLGGVGFAGGKMKDTLYWNTPNVGATNESGFSGRPGSQRASWGDYGGIGTEGNWWTNNSYSLTQAVMFRLINYDTNIPTYNANKHYGYSVRCVKD